MRDTMRWTYVTRKVARCTKFWDAQRSPELGFRSRDFREPKNLIFSALTKSNFVFCFFATKITFKFELFQKKNCKYVNSIYYMMKAEVCDFFKKKVTAFFQKGICVSCHFQIKTLKIQETLLGAFIVPKGDSSENCLVCPMCIVLKNSLEFVL